jgi:hypothetical protein
MRLFSNDLLSLNLEQLYRQTLEELIQELDRIDAPSIELQSRLLMQHLEKTFKKRDKRYETYYHIAEELLKKDYLLSAVSLLYESARLCAKTYLKDQEPEIVSKIEQSYRTKHGYDLYRIGDFFTKLKNKNFTYSKFRTSWERDYNTSGEVPISEREFNRIKALYPEALTKRGEYERPLIDRIAYLRNNLAHANASGKSFNDIKKMIEKLFKSYRKRCVLPSS